MLAPPNIANKLPGGVQEREHGSKRAIFTSPLQALNRAILRQFVASSGGRQKPVKTNGF